MKWKALLTGVLSAALLVACGGQETAEPAKEEVEPKTEETKPAAAEPKEASPQTDENGYIVHENATASGKTSNNAIEYKVNGVAVTNDLSKAFDQSELAMLPEEYQGEKKAVVINVEVKNTSDKDFDVYPDQGKIVTSTGEQVEADMVLSEQVGGTLYAGGSRTGGVVFVLKNTPDVTEINSLKYIFSVNSTEDMGVGFTEEVKTDITIK